MKALSHAVFSCLLFVVLLFIPGCSKKEASFDPNRPLTSQEQQQRALLEQTLQHELDDQFSPATLRQKCLDHLVKSLKRMLQKQRSDTNAVERQKLQLWQQELAKDTRQSSAAKFVLALIEQPNDNIPLDAYTAQMLQSLIVYTPAQSIYSVQDQLEKKHMKQLAEEHQLLTPKQAREAAEKRAPLITSDKVTISFKTRRNQTVKGRITGLNKNIVKIGGTIVAKEDLTEETQAQLWFDEHEIYLQRAERDAMNKIMWARSRYLPRLTEQQLPPAFLQAGYIPDITQKSAALKMVDCDLWTTGPELLKKLTRLQAAKRQEYIANFWKQHGYTSRKLPGATQPEWVPKSIVTPPK